MSEFFLMENTFELPEGFALKLMFHMAQVMDNNNLMWETNKDIGDDLDVSERTVSRAVQELLRLNIIKRYRGMIYMINPNYIRKDTVVDEEPDSFNLSNL